MAKLAIYKNRQHLFNYYLEEHEVILGRSKDVHVPLDSEAVSRRHLRFRRHGATYTVEDLSNKNGMFVNGQFTNMHVLKDGDRIEVPQHLLVFQRSEGEVDEARQPKHTSQVHKLSSTAMEKLLDTRALVEERAPTKVVNVESTARMSPGDLEKLLKANQVRFSAHLAWVDGSEKKTIVLRDQTVDIGWSNKCHVVLPGPSVLGQIAARIVPRQEGGFVLEAISRWPWVKVGGERVQEHVLKDGDIIEIGSAKIRFHADLLA